MSLRHPPPFPPGADAERLPASAPRKAALLLLVLGGVLMASWRRVRQTHERRHARSAVLQPDRLHTWEGEGGRPQPEAASASEAVPAR